MITPFVLDYNTITLYLSKITELLYQKYLICRLMQKYLLIPHGCAAKRRKNKARNISGFAKLRFYTLNYGIAFRIAYYLEDFHFLTRFAVYVNVVLTVAVLTLELIANVTLAVLFR